MITTKRPNTSDYTQVGFIEAKDTQGNYQNIDHIYDSEGNIVFQQGYLNEYDGANDFRIPAIGKPLIDYAIYGNAFQDGIPTSDDPIMPEGAGERTGNLFDLNSVTTNERGETRVGVELPAGAYCITNLSNAACYWRIGVETQTGNQINPSAPYVYINAPDTLVVWVGANSNKSIMLNTGSTALSYEPYGYKLDISSGGVNLWGFHPEQTLGGVTLSWNGEKISYSGTCTSSQNFTMDIKLKAGTYTLKANANRNPVDNNYSCIDIYRASPLFMVIISNREAVEYSKTFTIYEDMDAVLRMRVHVGVNYDGFEIRPMLNSGSASLPYEPYVDPTVKNIYLGEVDSTRRIKKLVLTGEEGWQRTGNGAYYLGTGKCPNDYLKTLDETIVACTHYVAQKSVLGSSNVNDNCISFFGGSALTYEMYIGARDVADVEAFKSYLAAQYAAGTPVTVWYVLATPTTGIVNEPLMRIGDYADSVNFSQAGVEIPTLKRPNTTEIDITTSLPPSEVYAKYRGSKTQKYDLFLAANGDSFEAKNGQSLYIGDDT